MKSQPSSRRKFLQKAALVTAGITVFSSSKTAANVFNSASPYPHYNPFTSQKTDLRTPLTTAPSVKVNGILLDKVTNLPVANAKVEVWHVSPGSKKVRHRAHFYTDALGNYSFVTDMPNKTELGSPRIYFRFSSGASIEQTQLVIGAADAYIDQNHWARQNKFNPKVLPRMTKPLGKRTVSFTNVI
ncbi:MAG: hypothetical protein ABJM06_00765 [Gilvibacter sp.]